MLRFLLTFIAVVIGLFAAELLQPVQQGLVQPWTALLAKTSASIVQAFDRSVIAEGIVLRSARNGFGVSIQPGCNGVEASVILIAAMLAFAAPWRHKLIGIVLGLLAVQAVNLLRIVSLFYLGQWRTDVFQFAHLYLWQALIMLDVLVVWLLWVRWLPPPRRASA
jgi:exosortase H (IPTLxxWG-CTERM-specific)